MSLEKLLEKNTQKNKLYEPEFFRLNNPEDYQRLDSLLNRKHSIQIFDELHGQLEELIKCLNPNIQFNPDQLSKHIKAHLRDKKEYEYGVWVYYSWSERLVHILDEDEFIELRTARNQYKITKEEKKVLSEMKIGIIGLSVGQSIAVTMAQERIFGELRIADFDILELSNLNRVRTGVHNLGLLKVINVAREIAEIDPFLKVTCFNTGVNESNINDFLLNGGKLNLLIDECDGLDIKILCREKAKEFNIPVIMETSDNGMIDIERFDLELNRPIFHGLINDLDISNIKELKTSKEKLPFVQAILGFEKISKRLKKSMLEIGKSITTWPQLASSVTIGGGITTDICRRIALNQFHDSGRYYINVEELVADRNGN